MYIETIHTTPPFISYFFFVLCSLLFALCSLVDQHNKMASAPTTAVPRQPTSHLDLVQCAGLSPNEENYRNARKQFEEGLGVVPWCIFGSGHHLDKNTYAVPDCTPKKSRRYLREEARRNRNNALWKKNALKVEAQERQDKVARDAANIAIQAMRGQLNSMQSQSSSHSASDHTIFSVAADPHGNIVVLAAPPASASAPHIPTGKECYHCGSRTNRFVGYHNKPGNKCPKCGSCSFD